MQVDSTEKKIETAIIAALKYFHVFRHPLLPEEIYSFLTIDISIKKLLQVLDHMLASGQVYCWHNYYMLENNEQLVIKRQEGAERAQKLMDVAIASANRIGKFPFVKAVCISGSLSKGYANEKSDIDLFIITQKKRLWISRTFLHLFKKLTFLWKQEHSYCMNYFIDESKLQIEEQNIFTATEMATLIPIYNKLQYHDLINANKCWLVKTFPNMEWSKDLSMLQPSKPVMKSIVEGIMNILLPKQVNLALMYVTDKWWRHKWAKRNYPMHDYDLAMKTKWYVSKNHPLNYQKKVLRESEAAMPMAGKLATISG